jgi:hypothetical protein
MKFLSGGNMIKNKFTLILFIFFLNIHSINAVGLDFSWGLIKIYTGVEKYEERETCFEFSSSLFHLTLESDFGLGLDINPVKYWNWNIGRYQMLSFTNATLYYNFFRNDEVKKFILGPFVSINWLNLYEMKYFNIKDIIFNCGLQFSFAGQFSFATQYQYSTSSDTTTKDNFMFIYNVMGIEIGYKNNMGRHGFYCVFQITDPSFILKGLVYLIFPKNKYL